MACESRRRILVVDDEAVPRRVAEMALSAEHDVATVECAADALDLLEVRPYDLLITDGEMPGMKGIELLALMREVYPAVATLMVSGNIDDERREWLEAHRVPYLEKPYAPARLVEKVRSILSER